MLAVVRGVGPLLLAQTGPSPSVLPSGFPPTRRRAVPGSSPAALLGFSFLCTLPPGVLASHSCPSQQWALPGCACPSPQPVVGCCSCQSPQDCGPHQARGCWESPFCIPQVGRGSKGSPQPPVSPRLGVLGTQHHLSLAGGGRGREHGIRAAGVRSPRGAGGDGWERNPRPGLSKAEKHI